MPSVVFRFLVAFICYTIIDEFTINLCAKEIKNDW